MPQLLGQPPPGGRGVSNFFDGWSPYGKLCALVVCIGLPCVAAVEIAKIRAKAEIVHAEQEIQHDKARPLKVWEKKQ